MTTPDFEARLTAVESRVETAAADAAAARHLAAANDRDYADLAIRVDANRQAVNALGVQSAARFDGLETKIDQGFAEVDRRFAEVDRRSAEVDRGFAEVDRGFAEVRGRLDAAAAGQEQIVRLLTTLVEQGGSDPA